MKPEEALGFVERVRGEVASRSDGERAAEALRIVLAMAKAAAGMTGALEAAHLALMTNVQTPSFAPRRTKALAESERALETFRKASGGDAPSDTLIVLSE